MQNPPLRITARRLMMNLGATVLLACLACSPVQAQALSGTGVLLMHGKGGVPGGHLTPLARALEAEGALVLMPRMAWHGSKGVPAGYLVTYETALADIQKGVEELRAQGAGRIVIAGQSLGANAALAHAVRQPAGIAAIVMLAPGQTPDRMNNPAVQAAKARAKDLVAAGKGDAVASYPDLNQGKIFNIEATAAAYWSYFDPEGAACMPCAAPRLQAMPLMWVIGTRDPLLGAGTQYVYDKVPAHPKSRYLEVEAGHFDTPDVARDRVVEWLKSL